MLQSTWFLNLFAKMLVVSRLQGACDKSLIAVSVTAVRFLEHVDRRSQNAATILSHLLSYKG